MNGEQRSLALLRSVNPVSVDRSLAERAPALATFEQIVAERRRPPGPRRRRVARWGESSRLVRRVRLAVSGGAAAAAVIIAVVLSSGSAAAPAFAGWSARPTVASTSRIGAAVRTCDSLVPLVLVDTRGPYTAALFGARYGGVACLWGPSMSFSATLAATASSGAPIGVDQIQTLAATGTDSRGDAFVLLAGRVGSAVTAVAIHRSSGREILASVKDGWYLAWWPARVRGTGATVTTSHGSRTIALPTLATQPPTSCAGHGDGACAAVGGGTGGTGASGLLSGPPMIGEAIAKPFGNVLLFLVYNASSVELCVHPGAAPQAIRLSAPPATNCTHAHLLVTLPRSYPIQRNLLDLFHDSVWMVKLPGRVTEHGTLTAYLKAFGSGPWRRGEFGEIATTW